MALLKQGEAEVLLLASFIFLDLDSLMQGFLVIVAWVYTLAIEITLEKQ